MIPDFICGLGKYYLEKGDVSFREQSSEIGSEPKSDGIAYLSQIYETKQSGQDFSFEAFFLTLYRHLEIKINQELKSGIDNVWELREPENKVKPHGRIRYATISLKGIEMVSLIKSDASVSEEQ